MGTLDLDMLNACPILLDLQAQLQAYDVSEIVYLSRGSNGSGPSSPPVASR